MNKTVYRGRGAVNYRRKGGREGERREGEEGRKETERSSKNTVNGADNK